MARGGIQPKGGVKIIWSTGFAYAIGLIASDGNLSPDGRHILFTSKDIELIELFKKALNISSYHVGRKSSGSNKEKKYYVVQFSDVLFYNFLLSIGIGPKKSLTLGIVDIPSKYFFDFLRGVFDGDGTFYSYWDKRWRSSFMFYSVFVSASKRHTDWLRREIKRRLKIFGHVSVSYTKINPCYQLRYAKKESLVLLSSIYHGDGTYLSRKRLKIDRALAKIGLSL